MVRADIPGVGRIIEYSSVLWHRATENLHGPRFSETGKRAVKVNKKPFEQYFFDEMHRMIIRQPLQLSETLDKFDILINVQGGGVTGQAGAVRHGLSRALVEFNPEFRPILKKAGF